MLNFSAEFFPKHQVGIQRQGLCEGRDKSNCVIADKCIRNENGVWFCPPNKGRGGIRPPVGFEEMTHSNSRNQRK
jgi:hypothetical protein